MARDAAQCLAKSGVKVGITGFCMGGAVANLAACRVPEVSAAVVFYGLAPETAFKFYRYEAGHGFMNQQRDVHERKAAELGWKRMLAFWKMNL